MTRWYQVSGGVGSWLAAKVGIKENPHDEHRFVFADTLYEDADCYRFLLAGVSKLVGREDVSWIPSADQFPDYQVDIATPIEAYSGNPEWRAFLAALRAKAAVVLPELTWLVEGRDIWEIMRDERMLGNARFDPCSKVAKRQMLDAWRVSNCSKQDVFCIGIGNHERHRYDTLKDRMLAGGGWIIEAPLIDSFEGEIYSIGAETRYLQDAGLARPRLYDLDYAHNNCGGFCIKGGHKHWLNRLRMQPERFWYDARMEAKLVAYIGGNAASILSDRRGDNKKKPLTLLEFAARYADDPTIQFDFLPGESGCGCAIDYFNEGIFG